MISILIAIILAFVCAGVLLGYAERGYELRHTLSSASGVGLFVAAGFAAILYAFMGYSWFAAEYKAGIINREYNTNYTQAEVFYASNVIETVRQLNRNRYEINGNLLKESKEK